MNMPTFHEICLWLHLSSVAVLGGGLVVTDVLLRRARRADGPVALAHLLGTAESVAYRWTVVPGGVAVGLSGLGLMAGWDWNFLAATWLVGMWLLWLLEAVDGVALTHPHLRKLSSLAEVSVEKGYVVPELHEAMNNRLLRVLFAFDVPVFFGIVALGALRIT